MGAIDTITAIGKRLVDVHDLELKGQLQQMVIDAQGEVLALQEKLSSLRTENEDLKQQLRTVDNKKELRGKLVRRDNAYWMETKDGEVPYCTACFDDKGKLISLHRLGPESVIADCPVCKIRYLEVFGKEKPAVPRVRRPSRPDQFRIP